MHTCTRRERRVSTHSLLHVNLQHWAREEGSCNSLSLSLFHLPDSPCESLPSHSSHFSVPQAFLYSSLCLFSAFIVSLSLSQITCLSCVITRTVLSHSLSIVYHMCDGESIVVTSRPSSPVHASFECTCKSHMNHCSFERFNCNVPVNLSFI